MELKQKKAKTDPLSQEARDIVAYVTRTPRFFSPIAEILFACSEEDELPTVQQIINGVSNVTDDQKDEFRDMILGYFGKRHKRWPFHKKRSFLTEELAFVLSPALLELSACEDPERFREAFFEENGKAVGGDYDTDVAFKESSIISGVECKICLSNWITQGGKLEADAERKLKYLTALPDSLREHYDFRPWLGTLEADTTECSVKLREFGFESVGVLSRGAFLRAFARLA